MTLLFENETDINFDFDPKEAALNVVEKVLESEDFPYEAQISLTLTGEDEIRSLNNEARGIDAVTDVLSFPMLVLPAPSDFSHIEEDDGNFDYETGEALLGDIVICVQKVFSQAEEFGHGVLREFSFLIAHSMLHLVGYDHLTESDENTMFSRQERVLESLGITR